MDVFFFFLLTEAQHLFKCYPKSHTKRIFILTHFYKKQTEFKKSSMKPFPRSRHTGCRAHTEDILPFSLNHLYAC